MSDFMGDLTGVIGAAASNRTPAHNTKKNNTSLDMTDFLQLMIVQLQNQTMDDTMDTSEMINQMVQMQMITAMTNMTDASVMSYASSLVGKEVTVVQYDGSTPVEMVVEICGTGTYGGNQVVFDKDGNMYALNEIMAVGRIPDKKDEGEDSGEGDPAVPDVGGTGTNPAVDELLDAVDKTVDDIRKAIQGSDKAEQTDQNPPQTPTQELQNQTASVTDRPVDASSAEIEDTPSEDSEDGKVEGVAGTEGV